MERQIAAISTGPYTHLDHLAPLCFYLQIPLVVNDLDQLEMAKQFYPMVKTHYCHPADLHLRALSLYDAIVTCGKFWAIELQPLIQLLFNKEVRFIFAPHGNSDKEEILNHPISQDIHLVYGPQMLPLKNKDKLLEIGNLRLFFYQEHKKHFDALARPFFGLKKTSVLYAPTWNTKATSTSFFEHMEEIVDLLAQDHHLLVKPHPLLEENDPALYHKMIARFENRVQFILDFPPIYPLLDRTEIYLGDSSSVGYDFLYYDRPLFFIKKGGRLQKGGRLFKGNVKDSQRSLSEKRKQLYDSAFGKEKQPDPNTLGLLLKKLLD